MILEPVLRPGRLRSAAVAVVAGLLLAACSSSTTAPPGPSPTASAASAASTPHPTSAVCPAAAELRASVDALAHIKIGAGTVDEIKSGLAEVEANVTALTGELHDANTAQASAAKSALGTLKTAVSAFTAQPSASALRDVATAVSGVTTAVGHLLTSVAPQCETASASAAA